MTLENMTETTTPASGDCGSGACGCTSAVPLSAYERTAAAMPVRVAESLEAVATNVPPAINGIALTAPGEKLEVHDLKERAYGDLGTKFTSEAVDILYSACLPLGCSAFMNRTDGTISGIPLSPHHSSRFPLIPSTVRSLLQPRVDGQCHRELRRDTDRRSALRPAESDRGGRGSARLGIHERAVCTPQRAPLPHAVDSTRAGIEGWAS